MTRTPVTLLLLPFAVACGGVATTESPSSAADGAADSSSNAPARSDDGMTTADAASEAPTPDGGAGAGACATAEPDACIACCRQPEAPNYGGFELYASDLCAAAPACEGKSPCGSNLTPAGGATCVLLLKKAIAQMGISPACATNKGCNEFAACLEGCGSRHP